MNIPILVVCPQFVACFEVRHPEAVHLWWVALVEPVVTSSAAATQSGWWTFEGGCCQAHSFLSELWVCKCVCVFGKGPGLYLWVCTLSSSRGSDSFFFLVWKPFFDLSTVIGSSWDPHPYGIFQKTIDLTWSIWQRCSHPFLVSLSATSVLQALYSSKTEPTCKRCQGSWLIQSLLDSSSGSLWWKFLSSHWESVKVTSTFSLVFFKLLVKTTPYSGPDKMCFHGTRWLSRSFSHPSTDQVLPPLPSSNAKILPCMRTKQHINV